ncbi:MAG: hypothetical protein IPK18_09625 [Sphingobacteriales bacterium]|nr:MAG: hypothetical protein IPK18_09625 [Sphingobacteriales bacterium]
MEYKGCLIIVSHDRYFLDKLTDWLFVFEGNGKIKTFLGNYKEYRDDLKEQLRIEKENLAIAEKNKTETKKDIVKDKRKLSFKEQQEFLQLEKDIDTLQQLKIQLTEKLSSGSLSHDAIQEIATELEQIIQTLDGKELRWLELSEFA